MRAITNLSYIHIAGANKSVFVVPCNQIFEYNIYHHPHCPQYNKSVLVVPCDIQYSIFEYNIHHHYPQYNKSVLVFLLDLVGSQLRRHWCCCSETWREKIGDFAQFLSGPKFILWIHNCVFYVMKFVFCILYSVFCILYSVFCILYSLFCGCIILFGTPPHLLICSFI